MIRKSFFSVLSISMIAFLSNAHSVVDFENYTPTLDKAENAEIDSAYLLSYTKTTEAEADFSTYEKDTNGQWQKVFYKYDVTYDVSKSSKPVEFLEGENQDKVVGHYFDMVDSVEGSNYGNTVINNAVIGKVQGDFIGNTLVSTDS